MSFQITEAFVKQYGANVYHLAQQKGSKLKGAVKVEQVTGEAKFFDRLGKASAQLRTSRHADTPQIDTPHSRRMVTLADYECADLIDDQDKIRTLISPENEYVMAFMWSLGRSMDDVVLAALGGNAYSGQGGQTTVALPNTQKIASVASTAGAALNVQALRRAKRVLDANDVDVSIPRYLAHTAWALENLLGQTEVTSSDYNTVKALVQGEVNTFLGFNFIRTERITDQSGSLAFDQTTGVVGSGSGDANGYDKCYAFAKDALILGLGKDITARISERADKSYSVQAYACMSIGAVRMEEEKVVEILSKDS